ncbi:MAG: sodium-translocating pyrophosphatase [Candidatus Bathyarchaeota archaeon]|nr:sodium-translocating pyrophosphatase [Candidatus Bathyarchaeota archaeon]
MTVLSTFEIVGLYSVVAVAIGALIYALILRRQVLRESSGSGKVKDVWNGIKAGANAYLRTQFKSLILFIGILGAFLYFSAALDPAVTNNPAIPNPVFIIIGRVGAFLIGAFFSAMIGYIGMNMAVQGNIRVSEASKKGFREALKIAYRTGTITGMLTDGLGLLGGTIIFLIYVKQAPDVLLGFGFGGTLLALFMRVGGGIYTKAADIGADLVGKVEVGIPEDDPRNAAVVADLVGDNVGDCAGMAADIFESYEVTMVSALILGLAIQPFEAKWIVFPLLARGIGVVSTVIGTYFVSVWPERLTKGDAFKAMDLSYDLSSVISAVSFLLLSIFYVNDIRVFLATTMGIILAISFNKLANHFTSPNKNPVDKVAATSKTGSATLILQGLALGFESTVWTIFLIGLTIVISAVIWTGAGILFTFYGVALAGIGMLTQTGNNVAMDTFGPIVDNANGIGEMAGLEGKPRQILADLDASGNTTKAVTKSLAIASAVLAAVALFSAFTATVNVNLDIADPLVFVGLLIGGALPFLFSFISIRAVSRAAGKIIEEVRKQFKVPGIIEGLKLPDYASVVSICTSAAQRELASQAIIAILAPLAVGTLLGTAAWGGFLAGVILTGQLLAVFMANSGGAWDNAKKKIEDGFYGGKYSESHKASVIGDTVGDPLKDTAGPALNPMIKVINLISLLFSGVVLSLRNTLLFEIPNTGIRIPVISVILSIILIGIVAAAIMYSKRETIEEERARDTEGPIPSDVTANPNPVMVNTPFILSAKLDDTTTGGSKITAAEYSLNGASWRQMEPANGALDSPKEQIVAKLSVEKTGVYNLQVRGTDEMGNKASEKGTTLVVYDPDAGFVTGEGWIHSPAGAYAANPALSGKATFKFESRYLKGTSTPTGQTEFIFDQAGMTFKSTGYDWLVVSEKRAQFQGSGTINDVGNFGFTVTIVDEHEEDGGRTKKFRIKIWDKTTRKVVYDNNFGYPDDIPPATKISGGSIDIHIKRATTETDE